MSFEADIKRLLSRLKLLSRKGESRRIMRAMGNESVRLIRVRTRLGYGVKRNLGRKRKLEKLKPSYVAYRIRNKDELYRQTTPRRSNLTYTGQLLNSLKVLKVKQGTVEFGPKGRRRGESLTNQKLTRYVEEQGRPFLYLSRLEVLQLIRFYRKTFGDLVNKFNFEG